jgi:glucan endo-1,3-beta-D-glucosidase
VIQCCWVWFLAEIDTNMKSASFFLLASIFEFAAARIYTGFNYGAFWSEQSNVKRYADFHKGFELAQNLTNTPVHFDSARLYTCITAGTKDDPTEAFQAAIDTGTNLLLGMWVSPGATGQPNDALVDNELSALGKAFDKYGQSLANLIIGLSVGNEDVYRFTTQQAGVGPDNLRLTIQRAREKIKAASWGKFMEGKPIGHTDTSAYAVMSDSDFIGMTAYPYWEGKSIDEANATFMSILNDTQKRAGNTPVWISEVGWPVNGTSINEAVASADNYQRYWNEVGCQVFGKYNTFWFELLQDSMPDQPDWGLLDTKTYQPRIEDLSCPGGSSIAPSATETPQEAPNAPSSKSVPTTLSTIYFSGSASVSGAPSLSASAALDSVAQTRTTHTTQTRKTTVQPTLSAPNSGGNDITIYLTTTTYVSATPTSNATMPSNDGTTGSDKITACIVMMDLVDDGTFIPVATYAEDVSTCTPPPRFTGSPFTMIAGPTAASTMTAYRSSFDIYAPSITLSVPASATAVQPNGPVCVTSAGMTYGAVVLNGHTYMGGSTVACPSDESSTLAPTAPASAPLESPTLTAVSTVPSPTSSYVGSIAYSLPSSLSLTTFLTVNIPATVSQQASAPAPPQPTAPTSSSSLTFSHSLEWDMFESHSTSPPPATTTPPPTVLPIPTAHPLCPDGAVVCAPASSGSVWAELSRGQPIIVYRQRSPVPCFTTNTCTWSSNPAPTLSPTCAKEGDTICLGIGVQAVIKDAIPTILSPRTSCTQPPAAVTACPPASVPVAVPPTAPINGVLSILSEAQETFKHTTWASPIPASSHFPAVVVTPIPAAAASPGLAAVALQATATATATAATMVRRSPGPAVPREPAERRDGRSAVVGIMGSVISRVYMEYPMCYL